MIKTTTIKARTLTSKKALKEIIALVPGAKKIQRQHVAGCGYVLYIKDAAGVTLAHATKDFDGVHVGVKA